MYDPSLLYLVKMMLRHLWESALLRGAPNISHDRGNIFHACFSRITKSMV